MPTKECRTCKIDFDEKYVNCSPCRKKLTLKAKEYRLKHGAEINARRLDKRNSRSKPMSEYPPKTCLHCGKTFQPSKNNWRVAKYCSKICCSRKNTEENKELRWSNRTEITCRECGIVAKPVKSDGTTCGKRQCVDESRRKTKMANDLKARVKGGHRYERYREYQNKYSAKWKKEKYDTDPKFNLSSRIRVSLRNSLKGIRKNAPTFTLLGYTPTELVNHLESQFTDGMSWDNIGKWHIDHIRPVASFNFTTTECEDFKKCWALSNLQPLWAEDNMSKGDKWDGVINA